MKLPHPVRSTAALGLWVAFTCAACAPTAAPGTARASLLLISVDSARRDLFGLHGHRTPFAPDVSPSPNIDRLAREGVVYEQASASSSWTLPSHLSLLTGLPDMAHGVDLDGQRLSPEVPLLAEVLHGAGYATGGVYSGPYLAPDYGFGRGFETYVEAYGDELDAAHAELERARAEGRPLAPALRGLEAASHRDRSADQVTRGALEELERCAQGEAPFFLFVHYFDPHYDYLPPPPYDTLFDPEYDGPFDGSDVIHDPRIAGFDATEPGARTRVIGERDLAHLRALYAGELASTDQGIGRLLARLEELGHASNTVVALVSDHGDEFFEHGGLGHRRTLFEEVLAVPLVLRYPARLPPGERIETSVSLAHLAPTLLELCGVAPDGLADSTRLPLPSGTATSDARPALARLVRTLEVDVTLRTAQRESTIPCLESRILESCRLGTIKVTRERRHLTAREALPLALAEALEARNRELASEETLAWIDLARSPGEPADGYRSTFDNPRARAALESFGQEYARLLEHYRAPQSTSQTAAGLAQLRGLGYVESPEGSPGGRAQNLRLEPPAELPR